MRVPTFDEVKGALGAVWRGLLVLAVFTGSYLSTLLAAGLVYLATIPVFATDERTRWLLAAVLVGALVVGPLKALRRQGEDHGRRSEDGPSRHDPGP